MNKTALIADDDRTGRRMAAEILRRALELNPLEAENGKDALRLLDRDTDGSVALIVLDLDMPVMGGLEALEIIRKTRPSVPVIVLTGSTDMQDAVKAMRMGAADFLSKPVEAARLDVSARNALRMSLMSREISRLRRKTESAPGFSDLVGHDRGLAESIKTGRKAAACDLPVLIAGETGTGKEMFAAAIHGESRRVGRPFVAVNCGAIPEKLVESTLFGHEKGAFTGAISRAAGKFQEASGGTIFLDEIGDLPPDAQIKLLRVLQQKEVEPVGAGKSVPVDVRIVSATHRDLAAELAQGRFREDLYFRLNVLNITLPPLRARKEDIPALSAHFMERFCASHQAVPKEIAGDIMERLKAHSWPGNVRELENVVSRAMALCDGDRLDPEHFSFAPPPAPVGDPPPDGVVKPLRGDGTFKNMRELEREIVAMALAHHGHNVSRTARALGIAKSTLYVKIGTPPDRKSA